MSAANVNISVVDEVLQKEAEKADKFKSTSVEKLLPLSFDIGNLLATDSNDIDTQSLRSDKDEYLKTLARDNTQLLINQIWNLPTKLVDDVVTAQLPPGTTILPREKPVPQPRAPTVWEKFAKQKGIKNKKKDKLVWDEFIKDWVPRYGFKRNQVDKEKNWVIEIPGNVDPMEDQFAKKKFIKSERIAKNELRRLQNIARQRKVKVPSVGLVSTEMASHQMLGKAVTLARHSTASVGKFQAKLPREKDKPFDGKKRKFDPNVMSKDLEKKKNLDVVNKIFNKAPKLDVQKATGREIYKQQRNRIAEKAAAPMKGSCGARKGGNVGKKGKKLKSLFQGKGAGKGKGRGKGRR